jgi:hypothetical protein
VGQLTHQSSDNVVAADDTGQRHRQIAGDGCSIRRRCRAPISARHRRDKGLTAAGVVDDVTLDPAAVPKRLTQRRDVNP